MTMSPSLLVIVERHGSVAVISLNHAPVNSLSQPVRLALWQALEAADADPSVSAIVVAGAQRGFCAGGELGEMRSPLQQASNDLLPRIEACTKPVIAAMHGFAIGGGLELALACHYRVAQRDTRIALPEIKHGVLPPSGSQRMPRALGVECALDMMVSGATVLAGDMHEGVLFDQVCEGGAVEAALALAAQLERSADPARVLLRHRRLDASQARPVIAAWRQRLAVLPGASPAMRGCVDAVECAIESPDFDTGLARAKRVHDELSELAGRGVR
jgi:enoyl-CoA hydratase/carnithine racemase